MSLQISGDEDIRYSQTSKKEVPSLLTDPGKDLFDLDLYRDEAPQQEI